jgi:hypothetical protein
MVMKKMLVMSLMGLCLRVAVAEEAAPEKLPPELRSCVGLERNSERLSCFDRGVAVLLGAKGVKAPSAESSFGMIATAPNAETRTSAAGEGLRTVIAKVTDLKSAGGDAVVTLDNGQVWRQLSGGQLLLKIGDEVQINRAALGSFQLVVPSGRSGKVRRLR